MYDVEDISEEYGAHGVQCYSVINNMEFYTVDVRASGYSVSHRDEDNREIDDEQLRNNLIKAVEKYQNEKTK